MLDRTLYIDRIGAFALDRLACLRNEYANNDCQECLKQCSENAFVFEQGKLRLSALCTQCGACMGACPTKALSLYGFSMQKALDFVKKEGDVVLTCQGDMPCLGALSVDEWCTLLLQGKSFTCNLLECASCEHNVHGVVEQTIRARIGEANDFVATLHKKERISFSVTKPQEHSRRAFFERFITPAKRVPSLPEATLFHLKKAMKTVLSTSLKVDSSSFLHAKEILPTCDNCKECVQFCPTSALSYNGDQTQLLFQMGKCIGCGICEAICKKEAIKSVKKEVDLINFAYDRAEVLIHHDLQVCLTCKCAFSYKGGEKVCERCSCFEKEHAEMFLLASQSH
ncbi:MAG: polyferredoxin-like protein [Proteobacteria bacterium]|nr:polyferredoxin-like protein [Pseudomonadota bacterium]